MLVFGGLVGFVAGLVVAGVVAIWIYNAAPFRADSSPQKLEKLEPFKPKADKIEAKPTGQTGAVARDENKPDAERIVQPGASTKSIGDAPSATASPAPMPVPKGDSKADGKAGKAGDNEPSPSAEPRGRLWLQVGAYANKQDAENQRARFAMLGYEAKIEATDVPDKGTVHRVRVGPYRDPDEAGKVRGELARQGIEVSVVKP